MCAPVLVPAALVHLGVAIIRFLQLQVFSRLAGEVHPLPFEPFDGGFLQQWFSVDFSHKCDIFTYAKEECVMWFSTLFLVQILYIQCHVIYLCIATSDLGCTYLSSKVKKNPNISTICKNNSFKIKSTTYNSLILFPQISIDYFIHNSFINHTSQHLAYCSWTLNCTKWDILH